MNDVEPAYPPDHIGDVLAVAHFDGETDGGDIAVALEVFDAVDVGFGLCDRRRNLRQHARMVFDLDQQRTVEIARDLAIPADGDPALRRLAVFGDVGAIHAMHHDAAAGGVVTHDVVARNRQTTVGEGDHAAFVASDQDPIAGRTFAGVWPQSVEQAGLR